MNVNDLKRELSHYHPDLNVMVRLDGVWHDVEYVAAGWLGDVVSVALLNAESHRDAL